MGAGKSKIGRLLAQRLMLPFADTDEAIEQSYGLSVAAIFRERGEAEFRAAERILVLQLLAGEAQVIALGGGAFVDLVNREALNGGACTIWLDAPFELIQPRIAQSNIRPLAAGLGEAELKSMWEERRQYYDQAQVRISVSDEDPRGIVDRILTALG